MCKHHATDSITEPGCLPFGLGLAMFVRLLGLPKLAFETFGGPSREGGALLGRFHGDLAGRAAPVDRQVGPSPRALTRF